MIGDITNWIMTLMQAHGGLMVFAGVLVESIIVPIPSPLIIMGAGAILIPTELSGAALLAKISWTIVFPGAVASTIGAFFTYGIGYWGGKPMIDRFSRYLGFTWNTVLSMEKHLLGRVPLMIFLLRALPIVPLSVISAAAGVLRLAPLPFAVWTLLGSIPRCLILAYLGFFTRDTYEGIAKRLNSAESLISGLIVLSAFALIFGLRAKMKKKGTGENAL